MHELAGPRRRCAPRRSTRRAVTPDGGREQIALGQPQPEAVSLELDRQIDREPEGDQRRHLQGDAGKHTHAPDAHALDQQRA
jgi:hypothetical protein